MCGIFCSVNIKIDWEDLKMIHHRGPDDKGLIERHVKSSHVFLGHTRLSIIDLSTSGHQPMASKCGRYEMIFNGEIYNYMELKSKICNVQFSGRSDTEVIINYVAEFGISSLKDLNGIFSICILDNVDGKLYLARDAFGVKPLYYFFYNSQIGVCSEIKPLLSILPFKKEIDHSVLSAYLQLRYIPSPYTLIKGLFKVRPNQMLQIDLENYTIDERLLFDYNDWEDLSNIDDRDLIEQYDRLLDSSVQRQLMSDVPVAVLLSGGVDSALLTYYVKKYLRKVNTFTVGFENDTQNEIKLAEQTSKILRTEHTSILIRQNEYSSLLSEAIASVEEPIGSESIIPFMLLSKAVSKNYKVVLSGQGVDEAWGGYKKYLGEVIYSNTPRFFKYVLNHLPVTLKDEKRQRMLEMFKEPDLVARQISAGSCFTGHEIKALYKKAKIPNIGYDLVNQFHNYFELNTVYPHSLLAHMMKTDVRMSLADHLLLYTDKLSMKYSLEVRVPYLDYELIKFVESLSTSKKISISGRKIFHKKLASKLLPASIVHRKKLAFPTPQKHYFRTSIGMHYKEMIKKNPFFQEYFDLGIIEKYFNDHMLRRSNNENKIYILIVLNEWINNKLCG